VGKGVHYMDWDDQSDRRSILKGPKPVAASLGLDQLTDTLPVVVLDELHKYRRWKMFLKGLFDGFADRLRIVVTGSSRLDVYRRGGDSLMGRYLLYHMHPLSVGELLHPCLDGLDDELVRAPKRLGQPRFKALWEHGGYPEPFVKGDGRFSTRWRQLRRQQLLREDVRDMTRIQDLDQLDVLVTLLEEGSGKQLIYSKLSRDINITVDTARRWVATLASLHHGFLLRPYHRNVSKSLRKEPKWYLRDWSGIRDHGQRAETFVACHLLKAVETWTDLGLGAFELHYLRDKEKREVDFVVTRDDEPWFLVEVKKADTQISPHLRYFQRQTGAQHAFQAVMDQRPVMADCFEREDPCVVPVQTLLGQLP
ncbi:MAG: ATP-binding protein, partial [Planctomycetota bacterium]